MKAFETITHEMEIESCVEDVEALLEDIRGDCLEKNTSRSIQLTQKSQQDCLCPVEARQDRIQ